MLSLIHILDDCSKDETPELIRKYIIDNNLSGWKLIENQTNQGWKKNFKLGFDLATGDYIFPCDQDDIWHLDKVQKMTDVYKRQVYKLYARVWPMEPFWITWVYFCFTHGK